MKIEVSILAQNKIMKRAKQHIFVTQYLERPLVKGAMLISAIMSYFMLTVVLGVDRLASLLLSFYVPIMMMFLASHIFAFLTGRELPIYQVTMTEDEITFCVFDSEPARGDVKHKVPENVTINLSSVVAIKKQDFGYIIQCDKRALESRERYIISTINVMPNKDGHLYIVMPRESFVTYKGLKGFTKWLESKHIIVA